MLNPTKEQLADPKWWEENAPEGAAHIILEPHQWWVKKVGDQYFFSYGIGHRWYAWLNGESYFVNFTDRPASSLWRGPEDGLPPVGMECEYRLKEDDPDDWFRCRIEYKSDSGVVACCLPISRIIEQYLTPRCAEFRPIRTPEKIAAEERDKEVNAMNIMYDTYKEHGHSNPMLELYDSGFRKLTRERLVDLTKDEPAADAILRGYGL